MSVSWISVPQKPLKKGLMIPLKMTCPSNCVCSSKVFRIWYHMKCGSPQFLTQNGDVICNCTEEFIKDVPFQCEQAKKSQTFYKIKSISHFLMSLSQSFTAAENTLSYNDLQQFISNLQSNLKERWYS
ncbi:unnamed protein product [Paramecium sonneborni]|uniref:Uncharacterized protein n=1 Tax=Paramecium sonneborni TaxID=65129 RepID=A0A8S1PIF0_9CILI|nr:unnamed protein product [Paramecium sonneborni]